MKTIMLTINTVKNVSTVQIKCGDQFVVEHSDWSDEAKFPFKALVKGVYKVVKQQLKIEYRNLKNKLITKIIEA